MPVDGTKALDEVAFKIIVCKVGRGCLVGPERDGEADISAALVACLDRDG